jgi:hypothetical protein
MTFKKPAALQRLDRIIELLSERPMTRNELAAATAIHAHPMKVYLRHLRGELQGPRLIRVASWRGKEAVFEPGFAEDAPHRKTTSAKAARAYWRRLKSERPDEHVNRLMEKRADRLRQRLAEGRLPRDPLMSAFFSESRSAA